MIQINDKCNYEAELKIKVYNPDGSWYWDTISGVVEGIEGTAERISNIHSPKMFVKETYMFVKQYLEDL